jgi:hypothetical protein
MNSVQRSSMARCCLLTACVLCACDVVTSPGAPNAAADAGRPTEPGTPADAAVSQPDASAAPHDAGLPNGTDAGVSDAAMPLPDSGSQPPDAGAQSRWPAQVLDLSNWKITLPTDSVKPKSPDEIKQPALATFAKAPYFRVDDAGQAVIFRAHAGGVTTNNSGYPRSELREMNGAANASWSTAAGTHTLTVRESFDVLTPVKPHAVGAQIHDANDDVIMIRLERNRLFVEGSGKELALLDANYVLGTRFDVVISASDKRIRVRYNGEQKLDFAKDVGGCYFKAGVYTQSNVSKGEAADSYAQVSIERLTIEHN